MGPIFLVGFAIILIIFTVLNLITSNQTSKPSNSRAKKLPLGKTGWPIIGETLAFVLCPEKFILDRMTKYSPDVFQTRLAGENIAVFCGPLANKFLFSNEGKLITYWLPKSVAKSLSYKKSIRIYHLVNQRMISHISSSK